MIGKRVWFGIEVEGRRQFGKGTLFVRGALSKEDLVWAARQPYEHVFFAEEVAHDPQLIARTIAELGAGRCAITIAVPDDEVVRRAVRAYPTALLERVELMFRVRCPWHEAVRACDQVSLISEPFHTLTFHDPVRTVPWDYARDTCPD